MLPACVAALGALPVAAALAQDQQSKTPLYTTQAPATLDKNYGLPTFGMPGSELPQQKTMAPEDTTSAVPDFFKGLPDITVPKVSTPKSKSIESDSADSDMDTPLYTTSEGSTTDDTTSLDDATTSSDGAMPR